MKKRIIAMLLSVVMIAVLLPFGAFADEPTVVKSGKLNDKITWKLYSDGVLRVDGKGAMPDYQANVVNRDSPLYRLENVDSIIIGKGITYIGKDTFTCMNVKSVSISSTVTRIGEEAFHDCMQLKTISFSEGLKTIEGYAFAGCAAIYVRLPDSLETIGNCAFGEGKLKGVYLGKNLKTIGDSAFLGYTLEYVAIPDSVKTIGAGAFGPDANTKLKEITLGKGVTSIKANSFPKNVQTVYTALSKSEATAKYGACTNLKAATWKYSHVHSYTEKVVDPICLTMGYTLHTCKHGDSYKSDYIPGEEPHVEELVPGYPATYDREGLTDGKKCSVCGKVLEKQKAIPKLFYKITSVNIDGLDAPEIGKKLDYTFEISAVGGGELVTEGEYAPEIVWYVFNNDIGTWEYIESKNYICTEARAYCFEIYADAAEHSRFGSNPKYNCESIGVSMDGVKDGSARGDVDDNVYLTVSKTYMMRSYDKAHTIQTVYYTDMPYYFVVGDKVADFKPAKLKDEGKTCDYEWYLLKCNEKGEMVSLYIPEKSTSKIIGLTGLDPSITKEAINKLRKDFGSTFSDKYSYIFCCSQLLHLDYAYTNSGINIDMTTVDGKHFVENLDADGEVISSTSFFMPLSPKKITTPDAPEISVVCKSGKMVVSWSPVPGADKYWIYRSTDGKNFKYYDSTTSTKYTNGSVTSGVRYYYKVKAVNVVSGKEYASSYSGYRSAVAVGVPTLTAKLSDGKVSLSWTKVNNASRYNIYRSTDGKNYTLYEHTTKTSYTDSTVNGGKYYYKIQALVRVNDINYVGDESAAKSVDTIKKPTLNTEKINGKVKLSWDKCDGAVKYKIYRSSDGGKTYKLYDTTTKLSYTTAKCESGVKYYFKVRAVNAAGYVSQFSNTKSTVLVTAPTLNAKLNSKGNISLSWDKIGGATKYNIYRSTDGVNYELYTSTTKTSYTNTSVTSGTTYYYRIKAVAVVNGGTWTSVYSNTVQVTK